MLESILVAVIVTQNSDVKDLIKKLSADDVQVRERSFEQLEQLGDRATLELEEAYNNAECSAKIEIKKLLTYQHSVVILVEDLYSDDLPNNAHFATKIIIRKLKENPERFLKYVVRCLKSEDKQATVFAGFILARAGLEKEILKNRTDFYKQVIHNYIANSYYRSGHIAAMVLANYLKTGNPQEIESTFQEALGVSYSFASICLARNLLHHLQDIVCIDSAITGYPVSKVLKKNSIYFPKILIEKLLDHLTSRHESIQRARDILDALGDYAWPQIIETIKSKKITESWRAKHFVLLLQSCPESMLPDDYYKLCANFVNEGDFYQKLVDGGKHSVPFLKEQLKSIVEFKRLYAAMALIRIGENVPVERIQKIALKALVSDERSGNASLGARILIQIQSEKEVRSLLQSEDLQEICAAFVILDQKGKKVDDLNHILVSAEKILDSESDERAIAIEAMIRLKALGLKTPEIKEKNPYPWLWPNLKKDPT